MVQVLQGSRYGEHKLDVRQIDHTSNLPIACGHLWPMASENSMISIRAVDYRLQQITVVITENYSFVINRQYDFQAWCCCAIRVSVDALYALRDCALGFFPCHFLFGCKNDFQALI